MSSYVGHPRPRPSGKLLFRHQEPGPSTVHFGRGEVRDIAAISAAQGRRPLIIGSDRAYQTVAADLQSSLPRYTTPRRHVPVSVAANALAVFDEAHCDSLLAIGGGSAIGLAKVVARDRGAAICAIPTTFAGSERTAIWGLTDNKSKVTGIDEHVLPRQVVYDPDLLDSIPTPLALASAMNALAHAVEALWLPRTSPWSRAGACSAVRTLFAGITGLSETTNSRDSAIDDLCLGGFLAGSVLATAGVGFHHEIAHVLGGRFDLPHAELHGVLLSHTAGLARALQLDLTDLDTEARSLQPSGETIEEALAAVTSLTLDQRDLADFGVSARDLRAAHDEIARICDPLGRPLGERTGEFLARIA